MKRRCSDVDRLKQACIACAVIVAFGLVLKLAGL